MDKNGPIVLIDDDEDDLRLFIEIFADMNLRNEVHLFKNTSSLIAFLQKPEVNPFLIISDIHMPMINGFQLRELVNKDESIRRKKIPYLFFSTASGLKASSEDEETDYQGIFVKPGKRSEWREVLDTIVRYWSLSMPPEQYSVGPIS
jgi:CheY-like chemotaxis protein